MDCYREFKLCYLKNLKLFYIVLLKKKKEATGFCSLLKAFSQEIDLWVTQVETKCGVRQIITIICVTYVHKDFKIQTFMKQLSTEYQIFTKLPQISHIHKNHNF